jgi:hypothetical protein
MVEPSETPPQFGPSTWLRWLGTLTFLSAAGGFLVEGWTATDTLRRESCWAAVTLGLIVLGIAAARRLRDPAGARIFLGLAAATIPAHFAQVGAETWAYFVEGRSSRVAVMSEVALLFVLAPPLSLGVAALVRKRGVALTALLFVLSSPLLLPTRDANVAAGLAVAELLTLLLLELRTFRHDPALRTLEGMAARALLLVPSGILLVRNAFYPATPIWFAALLTAASLVALALPHVSTMPRGVSQVLEGFGFPGMFVALYLTGMDLRLLGLATSLLALTGTRITAFEPKIFARIGTLVLVITGLGGAIWSSVAFALLVVPVGALHVLAAYQSRSVTLLVCSALAMVAGIVGHLVALVRLPTHDVWLLPAALGMGLLVLASIFERHRTRLDRLRLRLSSHFEEPRP